MRSWVEGVLGSTRSAIHLSHALPRIRKDLARTQAKLLMGNPFSGKRSSSHRAWRGKAIETFDRSDVIKLMFQPKEEMLKKEDRGYVRRHSSRFLSTLSLVKSLPITSVLDIGSGTGLFLSMLPLAWEKLGIDSILGAELTRKRGIECIGLDLESEALPIEDNSFDLVTVLEVIEHVRNKKHVLSEAYRVLKDRGFLVVTTPDARIPFWWIRDRILETPAIGKLIFRLRTGRFPVPEDSHKGCLSENELMDLIISHGFAIVGRGRFKIFQPNDDIVLIGRKHSKLC